MAYRAAMISVSIALSQTPAEAASPQTRGWCVTWNACLAPSLRRYQFILLGEQRHRCVNNLSRVVTWSGAAVTSWLQVQRPNHYSTPFSNIQAEKTPHKLM